MKLNIRNLFAGLVIIIVLAFVFFRGDQLVELVETMRQGSPVFMAVAILTQLGKYFSQSFAYHFAFKAVGEHMAPRNTLPLVFGTFFMNTIAPSLNLAGTTLVVDDARRRGIPAGKATSAALLMQITIDSGFTVIMLLGFLVLAITVGLDPIWFLLGLLVIALVGAMVFVMVMGRKRPQVMIRLLSAVDRVINRVLARLGKASLKPWVERTVASFSEAAGLIAHQPKTTAKAFGCSIFASVCELSAFCLVGVGFGVHSPEALMCGYVVATLFAMISVTPQGVGVVEAAVTVAFTSFGQAASAGLSIALVYRGIVFWMPFIIGAILIQTTKTFRSAGEKGAAADAGAVERDAARTGAHGADGVGSAGGTSVEGGGSGDVAPAASSDADSARVEEGAFVGRPILEDARVQSVARETVERIVAVERDPETEAVVGAALKVGVISERATVVSAAADRADGAEDGIPAGDGADGADGAARADDAGWAGNIGQEHGSASRADGTPSASGAASAERGARKARPHVRTQRKRPHVRRR